MADERLLSLSEAAERLHLTRARVRQLIDQGALHARRVGRQLVIEEDALRSVIRTRQAGRPVSPELAWGIALAADGIRPEWLSPVQWSRAQRFLHTSSPVQIRAKLARRAEIARYHASTRGLGLVEAHRESRPAGHSLADEIAIDLIAPEMIERYVSRSEMHELVRLSPLLPNLSRPNVILHVLADDLWRKVRALARIPRLAAASDLIEVGFLLDDDRWQRAGWELLEHSWPRHVA